MGDIRIMTAEMAGRIAAGEVIERPASVVKELVENAIDAGATRIRVQVEMGGQRLIQVTDNGRGMDREDALMCLEAHATSKMTELGDVGQIRTLGFRGEAIPSISSVSRFQLQTRRASDTCGTEVTVDYGTVRDVSDCGCAPGTNIRVGYLFGNLPARRKFLKGAETEDSYIHEMLLQLALARPEIAFTLTLNGREALRAAPAGGNLGSRVMMVLGREVFDAMLPVDYSEDGIHVYGFVSRPGFTRASRKEQRTIINGRNASSETLYFAVRDAYGTLILKGRYPGTVLYIDMPVEAVDVNVHPAKREVRFREPRVVGEVVAAAIRRGLRSQAGGLDEGGVVNGFDAFEAERKNPPSLPVNRPPLVQPSLIPGAPVQSEPMGGCPVAPLPGLTAVSPAGEPPCTCVPAAVSHQGPASLETDAPRGPEATKPAPGNGVGKPTSPQPAAPTLPLMQPGLPDLASAVPAVSPEASRERGHEMETAPTENPPVPSEKKTGNLYLKPCGRLGTQYILAESPTGLVVVNCRAAHQRILFERLLENLKSNRRERQPLLIPVTVSLSIDESRQLKASLNDFDSIGFSMEPFGGMTYLVTALPASFPNQNIAQSIRDMLEEMKHNRSGITERGAVHLAQVASHHAVSKDKDLTDAEVRQLLNDLACAQMPYADPAGRPTMVHITYAELDKRFKG